MLCHALRVPRSPFLRGVRHARVTHSARSAQNTRVTSTAHTKRTTRTRNARRTPRIFFLCQRRAHARRALLDHSRVLAHIERANRIGILLTGIFVETTSAASPFSSKQFRRE
jgi:hypothetical protein